MLSTRIMRHRQSRWQRRAAAVVEMAVVAPLLITLLFGIVEYGRRIMIHQTLIHAAREGCRTGVLQGSSQQDILDRVEDYMIPAGLPNYKVNVTRATPDNPIETVQVTVNKGDITLFGAFFGSTTGQLGSTCSMRKEGSL